MSKPIAEHITRKSVNNELKFVEHRAKGGLFKPLVSKLLVEDHYSGWSNGAIGAYNHLLLSGDKPHEGFNGVVLARLRGAVKHGTEYGNSGKADNVAKAHARIVADVAARNLEALKSGDVLLRPLPTPEDTVELVRRALGKAK